jgi:hypothetical protein
LLRAIESPGTTGPDADYSTEIVNFPLASGAKPVRK